MQTPMPLAQAKEKLKALAEKSDRRVGREKVLAQLALDELKALEASRKQGKRDENPN